MQIAAGGTVGGVCTAKLSEAEVMIEGGITDVLIPNQVVHEDKIARMCALSRRADMKVCVDSLENVQALSDAAEAHGVRIGVLIEVDTQMGRAGVRSAEQGVAVAKLADSLPGLDFRGVMSHQALRRFVDHDDRFRVGQRAMKICLDVMAAIESEGIEVEMVSSGETFTIDVAPTMPGITEVEGGSYALGGTDFHYMKALRVANKVLGTIISTPRPGVAIGDVGTMALSSRGGGLVEWMPGVTVEELLDDHVVLRSDGETPLAVGDKFMLAPAYGDIMIDRWDQFIAVRNGVVERAWDLPARGCTQ
jgi:3-hydroxy-D-aspartate aldolase